MSTLSIQTGFHAEEERVEAYRQAMKSLFEAVGIEGANYGTIRLCGVAWLQRATTKSGELHISPSSIYFFGDRSDGKVYAIAADYSAVVQGEQHVSLRHVDAVWDPDLFKNESVYIGHAGLFIIPKSTEISSLSFRLDSGDSTIGTREAIDRDNSYNETWQYINSMSHHVSEFTTTLTGLTTMFLRSQEHNSSTPVTPTLPSQIPLTFPDQTPRLVPQE